MSNYRRATTSGASYFFTVVTFRRRKILTDNDCRIWLREAIIQTRGRYPFTIDAWVLLPDHLHCIWTLPEQPCRVGNLFCPPNIPISDFP